ncbi:MAG: rod shape-determining protein MreD [Armatimonadota bacterium]|nr:rod shape-determining protein MreD [Armatimonadota bacterium]MCX7777422.1 rod shape-determining protein MreD [Armatimonadota bacterium]MDW8025091.1 rod shape-determining protein MreD [Armatimonadota bacterium]
MNGLKWILLWILCVVALTILAVGVLPRMRYSWHPILPDLFIITCICVGIRKGSLSGAIVGFALGLLQGSLSGAYDGQYVVSRLSAGFAAGWVREYMLREHWLTPFLCALVGAVACEITMLLTAPQLLLLFGRLDAFAIFTALVEVAYTVSITPIVILALNKLHSASHKRGNVVQAV